ncbi:MAG: ABC transporter permease, partial [Candidatus Aminicenantes bacterium]|nr:ABC transporter permease [Candidatus Aminicenantes bacterium]
MNNRFRKKQRTRSGSFRNWVLPERYAEAFVGDLRELYRETVEARGRFRAVVWLSVHLVQSFFVLTGNAIKGSTIMLKSYILTAIRNIRKQPGFSFVNIFGLAVGLSAVTLILFYLRFETSFDRFHADTDSLYRVSIRHLKGGTYENESEVFTPPIGEDMTKEFAEVEDFVRLSTRRPAYLTVKGKAFKENSILYASDGFFRLFSFRLIQGDPKTALTEPYSIVLAVETAQKIFGSGNPMGEMIDVGSDRLYTVTGVVAPPPANSTIQFESLLSFSTLYQIPGRHMGWNGGNQYINYVRLGGGISPQDLENKFPDFLWRHHNEFIAGGGWKVEAVLQPIKKIHFNFDVSSRTAQMNFTTFSAVALFILIIACINFVNLTTARAARRAREVGLRKVVGAHRGNLIRQFLGESIFLTFLAFLLGGGMVLILRPFYEHLLGRSLDMPGLISPAAVPGLLALILTVGVLAGLYPALYLSGFAPIQTLKGVFSVAGSKNRFRNILVVFQFAVSVVLVICTLLINNQLRFMKTMELGYRKENMLVINLPGNDLVSRTAEMRGKLLSVPGVTHVTASSEAPS